MMVVVWHLAEEMQNELGKSIFDWRSIYGLVILFLIAFMIWKFTKDLGQFITFLISLFLFIQIGHVIATMPVMEENVPVLKIIFRYDVLQAFAQLCVGTKVSLWLLRIQAFLNFSITTAVMMLLEFVQGLWNFFKNLYHW